MSHIGQVEDLLAEYDNVPHMGQVRYLHAEFDNVLHGPGMRLNCRI